MKDDKGLNQDSELGEETLDLRCIIHYEVRDKKHFVLVLIYRN